MNKEELIKSFLKGELDLDKLLFEIETLNKVMMKLYDESITDMEIESEVSKISNKIREELCYNNISIGFVIDSYMNLQNNYKKKVILN